MSRTMHDALAFVALVMTNIQGAKDREIQRMAAKASNSVHQHVNLWRSNRLLFRQKAELLFRPISAAESYIHAEKRKRLIETRDALERIYRSRLPSH